MRNEYYKLSDGKKCKGLIAKYPRYTVYWMSGFQWKGKGEQIMPKDKMDYVVFLRDGFNAKKQYVGFEQKMQSFYDWSAAIDIEVNHEKQELHFNGFSENDLY